ncbi:hypothetical protein QE424_003562 [Stenotrophomonas rhizophila]|uniref:Carboxypeptidase regulatory-like domain-containing protein n=1 Tax=Stenotrophomonas rhizophila TaxID=216778 RepID=A0AAP5EGD7_9GAMM|nr:hypothetical protein [Stenotrophomonas rhizophila]MDQ1110403.1 hypothetical protein [Stenotrophomonas rhizophila]
MSMALWIAIALALITLAGSVRILRVEPRRAGLPSPRRTALLVLQALSALLLYFTLVPPQRSVEAGQLTVLTGNAASAGTVPAGANMIALPEATPNAGAVRAPDLATALRQHPGSTSLLLVGDGLSARDRDTALPLRVTVQSPAAPRGWLDLQPPSVTAPGALFEVAARAGGVDGARAELLDPAGMVVDRAPLDAQGNVRLHGSARAAGRSEFTLRLLDAKQHAVDSLPVPQQTVAAAPPRVLILAGAPGPELKYLRRWASDTRLAVQAQANAGGGVMLGDAPVALSTARLAATDVLVLDERSLAALSAAQRTLVQQALRDGLGVVVRSSGPLNDATRQALRNWGLPVSAGTRAAPLQLPADPEAALLRARRGPQRPSTDSTAWMDEADAASHSATPPALERFDAGVTDSEALLLDAKGNAVGGWRSVGRGRIALLPVTDSYRLVLSGRDDRYAELWSGVLSKVARALPGAPAIRLQTATPWSGERVTLCEVPNGTRILDAEGHTVALQVDPASGSQQCAGYWPQQPGWHQLQHGDTVQAFYVFDPATAQPLYRQQLRAATADRLAETNATSSGTLDSVPGPRWPWLLAFIAVAGMMWWLERRRRPASG